MTLSIPKPVLFAPLLMFAFSVASAGHNVSMTINTKGDKVLQSCDDIQVTIDNREAARDEDQLSLRSLSGTLRVTAPRNGGVQVLGTDSREVTVLACKAIAARSEQKLDEVKVSLTDGKLAVSGPSSGDWVVYLLVKAPKDAALEVQADNGGIHVEDLRGQVDVSSENGPISVKNCGGTLRAKTENGPIAFSGSSSGDLRLTTTNGPISIEPSGNRWTGGKVVARTENGPVAIKLSDDFQSSFEVEASMHAPMSCSAVQCEKARKTWDDDHRRVQFGGAEPALKATTENGPISIESSKGEEI